MRVWTNIKVSLTEYMTRSVLSYFDMEGPSKTSTSRSRDENIEVFTDGSCIGNGRKNSRGGLAVVFPKHREHDLAEPLTGTKATNNRAELLAIVRALQIVQSDIDPSGSKSVTIKTDSMLCVRTVTDWMRQWKQRGWKKADNQIPKNLDILKVLDALLTTRTVYLRHVAAHSGRKDHDSIYNAIADELAVRASNSILQTSSQ